MFQACAAACNGRKCMLHDCASVRARRVLSAGMKTEKDTVPVSLPAISMPQAGARPRRSRVSALAVVDALEPRQLLSTTWFVSIAGSDKNPGTIARPFLTIQHAANLAKPGDVVDIRGGKYHETVTPTQSGTAKAGSLTRLITAKMSRSTAPILLPAGAVPAARFTAPASRGISAPATTRCSLTARR